MSLKATESQIEKNWARSGPIRNQETEAEATVPGGRKHESCDELITV